MKTKKLKSKILSSFFYIIGILGVSVACLGFYFITKDIVENAQRQVKNDIKAARLFYEGEIEIIERAFELIDFENVDLDELRKKLGLDYLDIIAGLKVEDSENNIVKLALKDGSSGGTRIIKKDELKKINSELAEKYAIPIKNTKKARPLGETVLEDVMAIEYAMRLNENRAPVVYGGKIINKDFALVDKIHDFVFENRIYAGKPIGTVTVFQDDVRVATNVLDKDNKRAIGTRVSQVVYDNVIEKGISWIDRAFVVTDWYLTAYEPIKDVDNNIIGILYVGILERPFTDLKKKIFFIFISIIAIVTLLAFVFSLFLVNSVVRPLTQMLIATDKISAGNLDCSLETDMSVEELNKLAVSFNVMSEKLKEREARLSKLNKSYLDMISFVSHELKGILASTILNAYSLRDGFLGMVNFKQRKVLDSITRNLDHLEATVKNFLNLSRIEKGELEVLRTDCLLKEDIFDVSIDTFQKQALEKGIPIANNIGAGLKINADVNLLRIVVNNLLSNAIKYGTANGNINIRADGTRPDKVEIRIYNEGMPIKEAEKAGLFKKFSRLESQNKKRTQGTGLGLFISKEIIEKCGGRIWLETVDEGNTFIFTVERKG